MLMKMRLFLVSKNQDMRGVNRHIVVLLLFSVAVFVMTSCATVTRARENVDSYAFRSAITPLVGLPTDNNLMENDLSKDIQEQDDVFFNEFTEFQQGDFNFLLSVPFLNFFHVKPRNETPRNPGGWGGLGVGIEYFYRNNKSLLLLSDVMITFSFISRLFFPQVGISGAFNVSLTDNFHSNRFQLGYGLNFARNNWNYGRWHDNEWVSKNLTNTMLGLVLSAHYRFKDDVYFGVIFRPSFFELSSPRFLYEHTISLNLKWRIPL